MKLRNKEIEDYTVIKQEIFEFNKQTKELIQMGYIPIGKLIKDGSIYSKEFIKYKADEDVQL